MHLHDSEKPDWQVFEDMITELQCKLHAEQCCALQLMYGEQHKRVLVIEGPTERCVQYSITAITSPVQLANAC